MNFDQKARDWDKDPQRVERAKAFANEIVKLLGSARPAKALEFGSGTGLVSFQLKDLFKSITLVDNSAGMTKVLTEKIRNEKISNMKPLFTDIFKDKDLPSGIDIIYTLLTLHHVKDIGRAFEIFSRILNPGGFLVIGDLVTEDGSFHHSDQEFDGHKGFDTVVMKNQLISIGFTIEKEHIFTTIEREHNNEVKKFPLFMIAGKKR
jgi:ubiquinone/menaquinone biosynthesis C-methylase UbiE